MNLMTRETPSNERNIAHFDLQLSGLNSALF